MVRKFLVWSNRTDEQKDFSPFLCTCSSVLVQLRTGEGPAVWTVSNVSGKPLHQLYGRSRLWSCESHVSLLLTHTHLLANIPSLGLSINHNCAPDRSRSGFTCLCPRCARSRLSFCLDRCDPDAAFWRGKDAETDSTGRDGHSGRCVSVHAFRRPQLF